MLQWMELDDMQNLELLARDVLPKFKSCTTEDIREEIEVQNAAEVRHSQEA